MRAWRLRPGPFALGRNQRCRRVLGGLGVSRQLRRARRHRPGLGQRARRRRLRRPVPGAGACPLACRQLKQPPPVPRARRRRRGHLHRRLPVPLAGLPRGRRARHPRRRHRRARHTRRAGRADSVAGPPLPVRACRSQTPAGDLACRRAYGRHRWIDQGGGRRRRAHRGRDGPAGRDPAITGRGCYPLAGCEWSMGSCSSIIWCTGCPAWTRPCGIKPSGYRAARTASAVRYAQRRMAPCAGPGRRDPRPPA